MVGAAPVQSPLNIMIIVEKEFSYISYFLDPEARDEALHGRDRHY
jgi:hypothetical protein